jgi:hypothetical protein
MEETEPTQYTATGNKGVLKMELNRKMRLCQTSTGQTMQLTFIFKEGGKEA